MSDSNALNDWLEKTDGAVSVCGVRFSISRYEYGVNPDPYPWENSDISHFKTTDYGCEFHAGNEYFQVTLCEPPSDKWGNTATCDGGLDLHPGYFQLAYEGSSYTEYEVGDRGFIVWMKEKHPEVVSTVGEDLIYNGIANHWHHVTTNVDIKDERWQSWLEEFQSK